MTRKDLETKSIEKLNLIDENELLEITKSYKEEWTQIMMELKSTINSYNARK